MVAFSTSVIQKKKNHTKDNSSCKLYEADVTAKKVRKPDQLKVLWHAGAITYKLWVLSNTQNCEKTYAQVERGMSVQKL